jgi:phospholipid/cholesterol/gamma-HCH transport system substrate-binding protein
MLTRRIRIQLLAFAIIATVGSLVLLLGYMNVPSQWFGVGRYTVIVQLPRAAGLYASGNVTYLGVKVGRVTDVELTDTGVEATLSLNSDTPIPGDAQAQVHSVSGVGEQYVALQPTTGEAAPLKDGDIIPESRATVPPDINALLAATNRGIQAIPGDNVKTVIDESYTAIGGLGPEISRIVQGSTQLASDAADNLDPLVSFIDQAQPVLDSQTSSAEAIHAWAAHMNSITDQVRRNDDAVTGVLTDGPALAQEARGLLDRLQPSLPILLSNLVSINQVAITYQPAIEQLLVLLPAATADLQAAGLSNRGTKHPSQYLDFRLNINLPPACTTGFLPPQQMRPPSAVDAPERPAGDLYCRIPQDAANVVRGARNYPCITRPGKRAPTVKMCESNEEYVPLNEGWNWKGDPNATLSGQDIPQLPPGAGAPPAPEAAPAPPQAPAAEAPPPIAAAQYDPATGTYLGPDGRVYTQTDLAPSTEGKTWQNMLTPPQS